MQALQHQTGEGPPSTNREVEIRSLKTEIDVLKKQIAGQDQLYSTGFRLGSKGLKAYIH